MFMSVCICVSIFTLFIYKFVYLYAHRNETYAYVAAYRSVSRCNNLHTYTLVDILYISHTGMWSHLFVFVFRYLALWSRGRRPGRGGIVSKCNNFRACPLRDIMCSCLIQVWIHACMNVHWFISMLIFISMSISLSLPIRGFILSNGILNLYRCLYLNVDSDLYLYWKLHICIYMHLYCYSCLCV